MNLAGALLKQFDARGGDRKSKKAGSGPFEKTQRQAAGEVGMSPRQQKEAVRVNKAPRDQFEALVESDDPPSSHAASSNASISGLNIDTSRPATRQRPTS